MRTPTVLSRFAFAAGAALAASSPATANAGEPVVAKASCAIADRAASIVSVPTPEWPTFATISDVTGGSTLVRVALGTSSGVARSASVESSSGNASLDSAALHVAQNASFVPAMSHCHSDSDEYLLQVDFVR